MKWLYYATCQLIGAFVLFPLGLLIVGLACYRRAWSFDATPSIKPLPYRLTVDTWRWTWMNTVYGNPEDGVTGGDAFGSWVGPYNDVPLSRWRAFQWSGLRNWACGWNYLTWRPWLDPPPLFYRAYGNGHSIELGWQQRYGCTVMVCHFW